MDISEKLIEDLIYNTIDKNEIHKFLDNGLYELCGYKKFFRQVDLGSYGRLDLVGFNYNVRKNGNRYYHIIDIGVIEIKKGEINIDTFLQAVRYCKGLERIFKPHKVHINFSIILIGTSVCKSDFIYLPDIFPALGVYTANLSIDGLHFNKINGYKRAEERNPCYPKKYRFDLKSLIFNEIREYKIAEILQEGKGV